MKRVTLGLAIVVACAIGLSAAVQSAPSKPMGAVSVPRGLSLELKIDGKAVPVPTGKDSPVAAGTYTPASLACGAISTDSGKRELWTLTCLGATWGSLKSIVVAENATTTIDGGPPFTLKTFVFKPENAKTGGKVVPISLGVFGKSGEMYNLNSFQKGALQAPPIALQIVDEHGIVLATGTLPYG
jgi:hypothetical protein